MLDFCFPLLHLFDVFVVLVYLAIKLRYTLEVVEIVQAEVNIASCIEHDGERPGCAHYQAVGLTRDPKGDAAPHAAHDEAHSHVELHNIEKLILAVACEGLWWRVLGRVQIGRFGFSDHDSP